MSKLSDEVVYKCQKNFCCQSGWHNKRTEGDNTYFSGVVKEIFECLSIFLFISFRFTGFCKIAIHNKNGFSNLMSLLFLKVPP